MTFHCLLSVRVICELRGELRRLLVESTLVEQA